MTRGTAPAPSATSARHTAPYWLAVCALAAAAGVAGSTAGARPTGTPVADPLYSGLFAALIALSAAGSGRVAWLWLATLATVFSRGWLLLPAAASLVAAFASVFPRRSPRLVGVAVAAVASQVILRWPHFGFQGATALAAAAAALPTLLHALVSMRPALRRWVLIGLGVCSAAVVVLVAPAAAELALSQGEAGRGVAATDSALASVRHGDAESGTAQLAVAERDFRAVESNTGVWWASGARVVPLAAEQVRAVNRAASVAAEVAAVARTQAQHIDFSKLRYQGGHGIDLAEVRTFAAPLQAVDSELHSGLDQLAAARSGWLLPPLRSRFDRLYAEIGKAGSSASIAEEAVKDAPSLLGGDGPRTYFLGLLDTSESRGLGGLLVWYGELHADDGRLSLGEFGDALDVGRYLTAHGGGHLSGPADYLSRYGRFDPEDFIDASYSPDLPTVASVVSQLYSEAGKPHVDGMLVLDPRSLASLVGLTGPVYVPGLGELTGSNTAKLLETGEYALYPGNLDQGARKAALYQAMKLVSDRLVSASLPGPEGLAETLGPDVAHGDLGFWSFHRADQALLERTGLADAFPRNPGGDLLSVVTQNAANNKIDAFLQKSVTDDVTYDRRSGEVSARVTVDLRNLAPSSGLSYQIIGSYPGEQAPPGVHLPVGTNLTWLTLYTPLQVVSSSEGGKPVVFSYGKELGTSTYSGYVQIDSAQTAHLVFELRGYLKPGSPYTLTVHQQPAVLADHTSVRFDGGSTHHLWRLPEAVNVFRNFAK